MATALIVLDIKKHFEGAGREWPEAQEYLVPMVEKKIENIANALSTEPITLEEFKLRAKEYDNAILAGSNKANTLVNVSKDLVENMKYPVIVAKLATLNRDGFISATAFEYEIDKNPNFVFVSKTEGAIAAATDKKAFKELSQKVYQEVAACYG